MNVLQDFSVTVRRNDMTFRGIVAPKSGYLNLTLGACSSFGFGVVSVFTLHIWPSIEMYSR